MHHVVSRVMTSGFCLCAALASCTVFQSGDDDDGTPAGVSGAGVAIGSGGANHGGGGTGAANSAGGSAPMNDCGDQLDTACGFNKIQADVRVVNMLLVVDKSASMKQSPDGFDDVSKWDALGTALHDALSPVASDINFGLSLFPNQDDPSDSSKSCPTLSDQSAVVVPVAPGAANLSDIIATLNNTTPSGGTPTATALIAAYDYFVDGDGKDLEGGKYILLATDGGPNCNALLDCSDDVNRCTVNLDGKCTKGNCCKNVSEACLDDAAVTKQIQRLADKGIATFVVGIPGTEAYAASLDAFAEAGGKANPDGPPKYYSVAASGGVDSLTQVFSTITTQLVRECNIPLPEPPQDIHRVNVAVDCETVPFNMGDNWEVQIDGDAATLVLKGDTCEQVRRGVMSVAVGYGCPVVE